MKRSAIAIGFASAIAASPCLAFDESDIVYKPGPGLETVQANCMACHGFDYVLMNSFLDQVGWSKEVSKMVDVMKAPVPQVDRAVIIEYLTKNYGK